METPRSWVATRTIRIGEPRGCSCVTVACGRSRAPSSSARARGRQRPRERRSRCPEMETPRWLAQLRTMGALARCGRSCEAARLGINRIRESRVLAPLDRLAKVALVGSHCRPTGIGPSSAESRQQRRRSGLGVRARGADNRVDERRPERSRWKSQRPLECEPVLTSLRSIWSTITLSGVRCLRLARPRSSNRARG